MNLASMMKAKAIEKQELILLQFEADLIPAPPKAALKDVATDALLARSIEARTHLNLVLTAHDASGGNTLQSVVEAKSDKCCAMDPTFGLEISFLAGMSGAQGDAILVAKLNGVLPASSDSTLCAKDVATNVANLSSSPLASFVSDSARGQLRTIAAIVTSVSLGEPPSFKKGACAPMVASSLDKLMHLVSYKRTKSSAATHGVAALQGRYEELCKMLAKKEGEDGVTAEFVNDLVVYWWSCPPEWTKIADAKALLEKSGGAASSKKARVGSGAAASSSAGEAETKEQLLRKKTMSGF